MTSRYIDVSENWGVILVYDFDMMDWDDMAAIMKSFGMRERNISKAIRILTTPNSGLTLSNNGLRMSVVFIGDATSNSQFWNSIAHELKHVSDAIISYYGEDWDGEPAAYLSGYLFQCVVEKIAKPCF